MNHQEKMQQLVDESHDLHNELDRVKMELDSFKAKHEAKSCKPPVPKHHAPLPLIKAHLVHSHIPHTHNRR
jgi:hypothetical protein